VGRTEVDPKAKQALDQAQAAYDSVYQQYQGHIGKVTQAQAQVEVKQEILRLQESGEWEKLSDPLRSAYQAAMVSGDRKVLDKIREEEAKGLTSENKALLVEEERAKRAADAEAARDERARLAEEARDKRLAKEIESRERIAAGKETKLTESDKLYEDYLQKFKKDWAAGAYKGTNVGRPFSRYEFNVWMEQQKAEGRDPVKKAMGEAERASKEKTYKTADEVRAAFKAGKIKEGEAVSLLRKNFGMK